MSAIFLSYRRDDSSGYAGRLFDNLAERFGRERVFMDIETLEPGMDFVTGIDRAIDSCGAVIAMIGPNWIKARDSEGRLRLDNPHDFIRLEIASALNRGVRVIPVLVHNAAMPPEEELPELLRPLCRLQACEISDNRWDFDVRRLANVLEPLISESEATAEPAPAADPVSPAPQTGGGTPEPQHKGRTTALVAIAAVLILAAAGGIWWGSRPTSTTGPPAAVDQAAPAQAEPASRPATPPGKPPEPPVVADRPAPSPEPPPRAPEIVDTQPEVPPPTDEPADRAPDRTAPPEPSPEQRRQQEIAELIQAAEIDLGELRLTRPTGNNAFERYQRVLDLDPDHPAAREGMIAITERYHRLVEDALARGTLDTAQRHLDSAAAVDPAADWLAPVQREIDQQRRASAARPAPRPEPVPRPDRRDQEACLAACERRHQACRAEIDPEAEANCLRSRAPACEQRYEECMADGSKLFVWGRAGLESECAGVHAECEKSAAKGCASAPRLAIERCARQFDACTQQCRSAE